MTARLMVEANARGDRLRGTVRQRDMRWMAAASEGVATQHEAAGESLVGMAEAPRREQGEEQVWALRAALGVAKPA